MNKKILGIILVIIGLIALIGAGVLIYVAMEFSTAIGMLSSADPAVISQFGANAEQLATVVGTMQTILIFSFVWCIRVVITALYSIYSGINMVRGKK
jgi:hypothetical protein